MAWSSSAYAGLTAVGRNWDLWSGCFASAVAFSSFSSCAARGAAFAAGRVAFARGFIASLPASQATSTRNRPMALASGLDMDAKRPSRQEPRSEPR